MNTQPFGQIDQMIELSCEFFSVRWIWLYILIMSCTCFRVNPHFFFALMSRKSLLKTNAISEVSVTSTGLEPTTTLFGNQNSTIRPNCPNNLAELWVVIRTVHLSVCSYHVIYDFQSESTFYLCLNIKEILAQDRCDIWSLSHINSSNAQSFSS